MVSESNEESPSEPIRLNLFVFGAPQSVSAFLAYCLCCFHSAVSSG
jgi:hypothetical protein